MLDCVSEIQGVTQGHPVRQVGYAPRVAAADWERLQARNNHLLNVLIRLNLDPLSTLCTKPSIDSAEEDTYERESV